MKTLKYISKRVRLEPVIFWKYEDCWQKYCSELEHNKWFIAESDCDAIESVEEISYSQYAPVAQALQYKPDVETLDGSLM